MENPFEIILEKLDRIERLINELSATKIEIETKSPEAKKTIMNVEQVADYLNLAKATIYGHTMRRILPHSKRGKRLYFVKSEIDEWIAKHRVKTYEEIEQEASDYILRKSRKR